MLPNREHPLYYLGAETLIVAIYVWVGHGRSTRLDTLMGVLPRPLAWRGAGVLPPSSHTKGLPLLTPQGIEDP